MRGLRSSNAPASSRGPNAGGDGVIDVPTPTPFATRVSATEPDWTREHRARGEWSPGKSLLASIRSYQHWRTRRGLVAHMARKIAVLRHRWWSAVSGADIPLTSRIGGGLLLPHPNGIVVHPDADIGPNCLLFQQVTIGHAGTGVPSIGGHVDIGAGAKILGPITIGAHCRVGANSVVLQDVPPDSTVVGIPGKILNR
ncbi:serine acetyltransferase [Sphingomonas sp. CARO-RG-8B-R24-01]|uniref:serine O-acetyltransferase n=1 Tax=Sphingomonas sp. CARO-RG-8B-R24-01 TaxID=2914831 RepID=UPI001F5831D4|nr:serine acetyltransferase [Sphingomonas sp. CARO-RG-8B-R24-01]